LGAVARARRSSAARVSGSGTTGGQLEDVHGGRTWHGPGAEHRPPLLDPLARPGRRRPARKPSPGFVAGTLVKAREAPGPPERGLRV